MRVYLDNCCFNRPFDDQKQVRIRIETEAKLYIQEQISNNKIELAWSYILDYENQFNPFEERRNVIQNWKDKSIIDVVETKEILSKANDLLKLGIKSKDALHISCALKAQCDLFITTDDLLIKKSDNIQEISVINPTKYFTRR